MRNRLGTSGAAVLVWILRLLRGEWTESNQSQPTRRSMTRWCRRRSFHLLSIREKNCAVEFKIFNLRRTEAHWNANRKLKKLQIWKEYPDPPVHKNPQGPI